MYILINKADLTKSLIFKSKQQIDEHLGVKRIELYRHPHEINNYLIIHSEPIPNNCKGRTF